MFLKWREGKTFPFNSETSPLAACGGYLGTVGVGGGQGNCPKITSARGGDQGAPFLRKRWWGGGGGWTQLDISKVGPFWFPTHWSLFLCSLSNPQCPIGVDMWKRKPTVSLKKR